MDKAFAQRIVHEEEVAEGDRRLALLQAEAAIPWPDPIPQVTQLQQQIDSLVRERDALRANAVAGDSATRQARTMDGQRTSIRREHSTHAHQPAGFGGLAQRQKLRAPECDGVWRRRSGGPNRRFGGTIGNPIGVGSSPRCAYGRGIPVCSDVRVDRRPSEKAMFGRRCSISGRRGIGHSELIRSRYGLRGVRVGEASNPGPSRERSPSDILCRLETVLTKLDSSDEEPLVRLASGRNVARRVSVTDHTIPPSPYVVHARRLSRRVVLAPRSRLFQDHSSNKFAVLESVSNQEGASGCVESLQVLTPSMKRVCMARAPHCWMSWRMISPELTTTKFWADGQRARCQLPRMLSTCQGLRVCTTNHRLPILFECSTRWTQMMSQTTRKAARPWRCVEFQIKRRVGGTRDQSFHFLPRSEQQDTRVVWWCFLEGRPWFTG